jgi:hypothetical protein
LTQVVKVPEYTNFTLNATGSVISQIWNGTTGGIIAFLATGTVTINNTLSATIDAGFRGGIPVQDVSGSTNCSGIDEASPQGGRKGESLVPSQFGTASGREETCSMEAVVVYVLVLVVVAAVMLVKAVKAAWPLMVVM